jgi:hypothetical protein
VVRLAWSSLTVTTPSRARAEQGYPVARYPSSGWARPNAHLSNFVNGRSAVRSRSPISAKSWVPGQHSRNRLVQFPGRSGSSAGRKLGLAEVLPGHTPCLFDLQSACLRPVDRNERRGAAHQPLVTLGYQLLVPRSSQGVPHQVASDREPADRAACTTIQTRARPPAASRNPCNGTSISSLHLPGPAHDTGGSVA